MAHLDINAQAPPAPETENPYEDLKAVSARIDRVLDTDKWSHQLFESGWFRNILMIAGAQWIIKDRNGRWQRKSVPFIGFPRTYTNKIAEKYNDLIAQLVQGKRIPISCQPSDPENLADVGIAEIGESLVDLIRTEAEEDEKQHEVAAWLVSTGNCFAIPYYDLDERFGMANVPYQSCACGAGPFAPKDLAENEGACPECGGKEMSPAVTPEGEPLVEQFPRGAIQVDVCGPFEIRLDHRITHYKQLKRFVRQRRYDLDWAKEHWGGKRDADGTWVGGIDPDLITPDSGDSDPGQYYLDVLANTTSAYRFGAGLFSNSANATGKTPKVTAYEFYELPSEQFPDGIRAVRLGTSIECVVEAGELPSEYGSGVREGQRFLPLVHWGYQKVPGRFWYKTPLDDAVPLQISRNVIEANINITVQRMGNPVWLDPKGSGVDLLTGESGQVIKYNPVAVGGTTPVKPERLPAELNNLGPLIMWMKVIDDAIERVTGTFYLQGGVAPPGVTAACLSEDTKALTRKGWKSYFELQPGVDELYSLNILTGQGEWSQLKNVHIYPDFEGELYEIEGREISAIATANHKWVTQDRIRAKGKRIFGALKLKETRDINKNDYIPGRISLDQIYASKENKHFVDLMGWIVTEGCYVPPSKKRRTKYWTIAITQSFKVNADKCVMIEKALRGAKIEYRRYSRKDGRYDYRIYGKQADEIVTRFSDKRLGYEFISSLSQEQLDSLVQVMVHADGHNRKPGKRGPNDKTDRKEAIYMSGDPLLADQFQFAAVLAGYPTAMAIRKGAYPSHRNERYDGNEYWISLKRLKRIQGYSVLKRTQKLPYSKQLVWCPETELGTWLARRKGKAYVTGNSALAFLWRKRPTVPLLRPRIMGGVVGSGLPLRTRNRARKLG